MQSNDHQKLDDDILQCKADIQKALKAAGHLPEIAEMPAAQPENAPPPAQPDARGKNAGQRPTPQNTAPSPVGVHIPSFETLNAQPPKPAAVPSAASKRPVDELNETIETLKSHIDDQKQTNQQLAQNLTASSRSVHLQQDKIHSLERELAEKIAELAALKLNAEQTAATLAEQGQQLRLTGQEKESVKKQLDEQTAAWAQTLTALKTAQSEAAKTLEERQTELERLGGELAATQSRLQEVDAANSALTREKAELETLKEQAECTAASLAQQAEQLAVVEQEKQALQERLDGQAAEWAQMRASMESTAAEADHMLQARQQQIEQLREELTGTHAQLEATQHTNAELMREKGELAEALHDAQSHVSRLERESLEGMPTAFDDDEEGAYDDEPQPYCDATDEPISEDDVHLEQKLDPSETSVPTFNLAEQILAEQRSAAAARRQGPRASGKKQESSSIERVMRHYVGDTTTPAAPTPQSSEPPETPKAAPSQRFLRWQGERLSDYQQSLLNTIIHNDIRRFCRPTPSSPTAYPVSGSPADN